MAKLAEETASWPIPHAMLHSTCRLGLQFKQTWTRVWRGTGLMVPSRKTGGIVFPTKRVTSVFLNRNIGSFWLLNFCSQIHSSPIQPCTLMSSQQLAHFQQSSFEGLFYYYYFQLSGLEYIVLKIIWSLERVCFFFCGNPCLPSWIPLLLVSFA